MTYNIEEKQNNNSQILIQELKAMTNNNRYNKLPSLIHTLKKYYANCKLCEKCSQTSNQFTSYISIIEIAIKEIDKNKFCIGTLIEKLEIKKSNLPLRSEKQYLKQLKRIGIKK